MGKRTEKQSGSYSAATDLQNGSHIKPITFNSGPVISATAYKSFSQILGRSGLIDLWLKSHGLAERRFLKEMSKFFADFGATLATRILSTDNNAKRTTRRIFDKKKFTKQFKAAARPIISALIARGAVTEWEMYKPRKQAEYESFKKIWLPQNNNE